jgi:beta-glucanase (GH16 family)
MKTMLRILTFKELFIFLLLIKSLNIECQNITLDSFDSVYNAQYEKPSWFQFSNFGYDVYYEKATVKLSQVTVKKTVPSDKALSIGFSLSPEHSWGNWLSVRKSFKAPVNLSKCKGLQFKIKVEAGAEGATLRITLVDLPIKSGDKRTEAWWGDFHEEVLSGKTGEWVTLTAPFNSFYESYGAGTPHNDGKLNLRKIIAYEINVVSAKGITSIGTFMINKLGTYGCTSAESRELKGWKLVWSDEFDRQTIDSTKWSFQTGNGGPSLPGWGNNELEYYRKENASIKDGKLTININKEKYSDYDYTSVRMRTLNKGDWKFGKIMAKIKLPKGKGIWPAFWMMPTNEVYGGWPKSGEIDILELTGDTMSKIYGTVHYGPAWPNNLRTGGYYKNEKVDFSSGFHIYSIEWKSDTINWYVDSTKYFTVTKSSIAPQNWPFNENFHLILNCAVGGNWPGNPDSATTFPQKMEVDYIRIYQKQ